MFVNVTRSNECTHAADTEPFNEDGTFGADVFLNTLGPDYIPLTLEAAKSADPNAKLQVSFPYSRTGSSLSAKRCPRYINDFNIEGSGVKATAMMNLVECLQAQGTPIDGIGMQCHFIVGEVPTTLQSNMAAFTALGVEVAITELDIRLTLPTTDALLTQQEADYQTVVSACRNTAGCVGITLWDFTDKFSWVPGAFAGMGAACPWDEVSVFIN
jgi:endo-1,4-beta-xylanase